MSRKNFSFIAVLAFVLSLSGCEPEEETLTDIDGNRYRTVTIGAQTWMAENLRTTRFNDGSAIRYDDGSGQTLTLDETGEIIAVGEHSTEPAYCWYDNDSSVYGTVYGALYNWYAVDPGDGSKNVCPVGWHVSTDSDWLTLVDALDTKPAGKLAGGADLWRDGTQIKSDPNFGTTGFDALPGGICLIGSFSYINEQGSFWNSTATWNTDAWFWTIYDTNGIGSIENNKNVLSSVRCVKD